MHKEIAWLFHAILYSGLKPHQYLFIGSVPVRQTVHIEQGTRSHRNRQAVHIDAGHSFTSTRVNGLLVQLVHIENCTLSARKNAPSQGGENKKEKALISQDFFGLVVATGLEPVTPSM